MEDIKKVEEALLSKNLQRLSEAMLNNNIRRYMDKILGSQDEEMACRILDSKIIDALCEFYPDPQTDANRRRLLIGNGWTATFLLIARIPSNDSYRQKMLPLIPVIVDLYNGNCSLKTGLINVLAIYSYYGVTASPLLHSSGALDIFVKSMKEDNLMSSTLGAIGAAYVVGHVENHPALMQEGMSFFTNMKVCLDRGMQNLAYNGFQFDPCDVLGCVARLSKADSNKKNLISTKYIESMRVAITSDCRNLRFMWLERNRQLFYPLALEIIWDLSFTDDGLAKIRSDPRILDTINKKFPDEKGSKGVLFNIRRAQMAEQKEIKEKEARKSGIVQKVVEVEEPEEEGHVMISYCWANQKTTKKVHDIVKEAGFPTWIDIEQMSRSTLEAMANAVEGAKVILVFFSEDYKLSNACRTEAEYAYAQKKNVIPVRVTSDYTADGWLGACLGTKLWYDFSTPDKFGQSSQGLLKEIAGFFKKKKPVEVRDSFIKDAISDLPASPAPGTLAVASAGAPPMIRLNSVILKDDHKVSDLLEKCGLKEYIRQFEKASIDATALNYMATDMLTPERDCRILKCEEVRDELGLTKLGDWAKFLGLLDGLVTGHAKKHLPEEEKEVDS